MVSKRGLYLNILAVIVLVAAVFFLNATVLNQAIPDSIYRLLGAVGRVDQADVSERAATEALERENTMLRKQLGVSARLERKLVMTRIISIERTPLISTIIVDKGSIDGVREQMIVLGAGDVLAGKIIEVFEHSSRVMLVDDPRMIASVRLLGTSLLAEARGKRNNSIELNLVSHTDNVAIDQIAVTSGLDVFLEGLAVAQVTNVQPGGNSLFQKISGQTLFDFHESPFVFIIL